MWSEENTEELKRLWQDDLSIREIARILELPYEAVRFRARKLKLPIKGVGRRPDHHGFPRQIREKTKLQRITTQFLKLLAAEVRNV